MTMKRNLFLRLCLMAVVLSIFSCRQDLLPEKETYHNTSAFQLTSKRISLNESKHKAILLPELKKAEIGIESFVKNNAHGKVVNYGNGVSIDTDDVIYIENGSNYYTYTFRINRENAPADAPLENLVLTPLTDGTYREFLISYDLTSQEKQTLMNGGTVDAKGKTTITELTKGTYNNGGLVNKTTSWSCGWGYEIQYTVCSENMHSHGEPPISVEGGTCSATTPSVAILVEVYKCDNIEDPNNPNVGNPVATGPGYEGNPGSPAIEQPGAPSNCTSPTVLSGPQDPTTGTGEGGCTGIPTLPNLPNLGDNPCRKTNASISAANTVLKNPTVQSQMDAVLKGKRTLENEWATALGIKSDGSYDITPAIEQQQNSGNSPDDLLSNPASFFADGHTHSGDPAKPSAGDLYGMLNEVFYNANFKYRYVYGDSDIGTPEVYAMVLNDRAAAIQFRGTYLESKNYDIDKQGFLKGSTLWKEFEKIKALYDKISTVNTSGEDYHPKAVAMAYLLENLNAGISVAKVDNNGNLKKINVILEEITNPDGTKGQRVKVSKCP